MIRDAASKRAFPSSISCRRQATGAGFACRTRADATWFTPPPATERRHHFYVYGGQSQGQHRPQTEFPPVYAPLQSSASSALASQLQPLRSLASITTIREAGCVTSRTFRVSTEHAPGRAIRAGIALLFRKKQHTTHVLVVNLTLNLAGTAERAEQSRYLIPQPRGPAKGRHG